MENRLGGLIIFLRLPDWGKVKTRLAATAGAQAALTIYTQLTSLTLDSALKSNAMVYLFYKGGLPAEEFRHNAWIYCHQAEGDLGVKIQHALSYALHRHPKAVIIGSDCPELNSEMIRESFRRLNDSDLVIGPATDGGYYLLGCKQLEPSLFTGISWGTNQVLLQTRERIDELKLTYHLLPLLSDIDTEEDWNQYVKNRNR